MKQSPVCVMTIAGSDSSGGAGIAADLKTFAAVGVYGTFAITAVTAQNTLGVEEIFPIPAQTVKQQIETTLADIPVKVVKTGMLYTKETIEAVAELVSKFKLKAVVDPVFRAGTGAMLIREDAKKALAESLIPKAYVLTPNRYEAEELAGMPIRDVDDMKKAAEKIARLGVDAVIIKGGHVESEEIVTDILYHKGEFHAFTKPRIRIQTHGSGCTFS
ncbi:MAG TPA: bifunctional hydroxymethylpyrimidine kinase/phosphomethylpyrimidine kinase, partial [Candidatus Bathyarchaeota archaeon]|nr:bifunctional hydroxymethylpyrimidine kinase/phosphomethylpyrimidine kinase [Candidatus Bathyarchaeota archaeon]